MELQKEALNSLTDYLQGHGYPSESFVIEYPLGKGKYRVDLAILDLELKVPIALFEIKGQRTPSTESMGRRQVEKFLSALEVKTIPIYLVFQKEGTPPFEIVLMSSEGVQDAISLKEVKSNELPKFDLLSKSGQNQTLLVSKKERKRRVDQFTGVTLILAAFVIALLIEDLRGDLAISTIHVTLIVIFIGLVLIPFASRIKFAGIEFERFKKEEPPKKPSDNK